MTLLFFAYLVAMTFIAYGLGRKSVVVESRTGADLSNLYKSIKFIIKRILKDKDK